MVLVTGGLGFIGSHVCRELVRRKEKVVVFDNLSQGNLEFLKKVRMPDIYDKVTFVSGDITDFASVFETLKEYGIEKIVHTAAITFIPTAIKKPSLTFNVNTVGSFNLLEASRILDMKKFVYISTASTYGDFQYTPADEKHPLNPKDIYGATKVAADRLAYSYFQTYGLSASIVRTSAVYGPGDLERRAAKAFIENALQGVPMKLEGGGLQMRDFSYVKDVALGMVLALNSSESAGEAFNITGGSEYSVKDLAEMIRKYIPGSEIEVTGARKIDAKRGMLDISKAKRVLGYNPKYDLDAGIREYVKWMVEVYAPLFGLKVKNKPVFD
ncbi:MAG: SDR family NAD(P)-dependent oxidoreductase [Candidatus Aenigmarchaeota archaeon]|nr:SDR family NAD(P)-dependent oxidoreductase [Candidatus Aenigmarchaeota archaeon]